MQAGMNKLGSALRLATASPLPALKLSSSNIRLISNCSSRKNQLNNDPVTTNPVASRKYDIYVGVCIERRPVITKDLKPLEKKYAELLSHLEIELSKKSDHEIRDENDAKLLEKIKKGEVDAGNVQTAQDFEDARTKEAKEFQPASRTTEADKKNDVKSLERALQSHLLLALKYKVGNDHKWILPQAKLTDEETLREVADKAVVTCCPSVNVRILGNAPWAFYKYNYPQVVRKSYDDAVGRKIFFYKAQLLSGQMDLSSGTPSVADFNDFAWLTRAELPEYFFKDYFNAVSDMLIPEY